MARRGAGGSSLIVTYRRQYGRALVRCLTAADGGRLKEADSYRPQHQRSRSVALSALSVDIGTTCLGARSRMTSMQRG